LDIVVNEVVMGASGIGFGEVLIILAVVLLLFGSGKLTRLGSDLGAAIRGFRDALQSDSDRASEHPPGPDSDSRAER